MCFSSVLTIFTPKILGAVYMETKNPSGLAAYFGAGLLIRRSLVRAQVEEPRTFCNPRAGQAGYL